MYGLTPFEACFLRVSVEYRCGNQLEISPYIPETAYGNLVRSCRTAWRNVIPFDFRSNVPRSLKVPYVIFLILWEVLHSKTITIA